MRANVHTRRIACRKHGRDTAKIEIEARTMKQDTGDADALLT